MAKVNWFANNVLKKVGKAKYGALRKGGAIVKREAKALCPVGIEIKGTAKTGQTVKMGQPAGKAWTEREPGTLKKTIRFRVSKDGFGVRVIAGSKMAFYARFVEFGTARDIARPYLRPALHKKGGEVVAAFEGQMDKPDWARGQEIGYDITLSKPARRLMRSAKS